MGEAWVDAVEAIRPQLTGVRHFVAPEAPRDGWLDYDGRIDVRAVPIEKWERKGHQFIKLYVAYVVGGEIAAEIWHTAIFRVSQAKA